MKRSDRVLRTGFLLKTSAFPSWRTTIGDRWLPRKVSDKRAGEFAVASRQVIGTAIPGDLIPCSRLESRARVVRFVEIGH